MASKPILRARMALLDDLGIEAVCSLYLELGTVRDLCEHLWDARSHSEALYRWLDADPSRRAVWEDAVRTRGDQHADRVAELADGVTEVNYRSVAEEAKLRRWLAGVCNPRYSDRVQIEHTHQLGESWLEALRGAEEALAAEEIEEAEYDLIEDGEAS